MPVAARLIAGALAHQPDILVHLPGEDGALTLAAEIRALCAVALHLGPQVDSEYSVSLCWGNDPGHHHGLLVNLAPATPPWFGRFERLVELVYDHPGLVDNRRDAFRFYRERGYPLHYYDLSRTPELSLSP